MPKEQIDLALAGLAALGQDLDGRRQVLERAGMSLLRRPLLGAQLVARLTATPEDAAELEDLALLLEAALDTARMAQENRQKRGEDFLEAAREAVEIAARRENLGSGHRLILGRAWTRSGLQAPAALAFAPEELAASGTGMKSRAEAEAALEQLFRDLIRQSGGDTHALHMAITESFPVMPADMRDHVVAYSIARPEPLHEELACFWLLDPSPAIRLSAAMALAERFQSGVLSEPMRARLIMLRSWMPEDAARARLDGVLRDILRAGASAPAIPSLAKPIATKSRPWTPRDILVTLPDGGGAQSLCIALQRGTERRLAMLLLKQGQGVKDAYVIPCASMREQKALMQQMVAETDALAVPLAFVERLLAMALAEGLEQNLPPAAGLTQIAALCGFTTLRPQPMATEALLAELACARDLAALTRPARGALVESSAAWLDSHAIVQSWFEDSDGAHEPFDVTRGPRALKSTLWTWLETRRDWWALIMARSAATLEAAGHPDAPGFAATAMALKEGRKLKTIPIMADIHEQTIEAWLFDPQMDEAMPPTGSLPPAPETRGELARLLQDSDLSSDRIDGYLMAAILAPKMLAPDRWLAPLLTDVMRTLPPAALQRFLDIVMMRANDALALAGDAPSLERILSKRSKAARQDWAAGFTAGHDAFRSSWPAKATTSHDRSMLLIIAEAARTPLGAADIQALSAWIMARDARNRHAE